MKEKLPPSLVSPNIPLHLQTISQLVAERNYWKEKLLQSPGPASATAAHEFLISCNRELIRRGITEKEYTP